MKIKDKKGKIIVDDYTKLKFMTTNGVFTMHLRTDKIKEFEKVYPYIINFNYEKINK